jgi:hypothetical protein
MQGWQTYGMQKYFLRHMALIGLLFSFFYFFIFFFLFYFISFAPPQPLYWEEYMYIYTYLIAQRLYMNYCCYQVTLWVKHFFTNREQREMSTGYLSLRRQPGSNWVNKWHWTKGFTISFSRRKWQQPQLLPNFLPHCTPQGGLH